MNDLRIAENTGYAMEARYGIPLDLAQTIARDALHRMDDSRTPRRAMLTELATAYSKRYPVKMLEVRAVLASANLEGEQ